tara:strand:+ start:163 stop:465 length:303 start_codon:yes stop_codon:yes gene_type:complete
MNELIELKDYELIPDSKNKELWNVRVLEGQYAETVLKFGTISFNKVGKDTMSFNFDIVSSPDPELTVDNIELQEYAGILLEAIIRDGIDSGSVLWGTNED